MKIKICGNLNNISDVSALAIDYIGLVFYNQSPRYAGQLAAETLSKVGAIPRVGVFVNSELDEIQEQVSRFGLNGLQLHGSEGVGFVRSIRQKFPQLILIKAFSMDGPEVLEICGDYSGLVDYFLFDTPAVGFGGSGKAFAWNLLFNQRPKRPYFLAGGIGPEIIPLLKQSLPKLPGLYGIDLNSKVETSPGEKDIRAIQNVIDQLAGA